MTRRDSRRFERVVVRDDWGRVDADGFHLHDDPRAPGDADFSVCVIDAQQIAVFVDPRVTEPDRAQIAARRPDWLDAVVFIRVASCTDALVIVDAEVAAPEDADPERCAFAATCGAFGAGAIDVVPQRYEVRLARRGSVEVTMEFDDGTESWHGDAHGDVRPSRREEQARPR